MKIVMLGHSGVGKTTFMACMYAVLQSEIGRFAVVAREEDVHNKLISIAEAVVEGTYPRPTEQQTNYDLVLLLDREPVLGFEWIDYRGNALNEDAALSDTQQLQAALSSADSIIAFLDGQALQRGDRSVREAIGRINVYLNNFSDADNRVIPLALVATKADLIDDWEGVMRPLEPIVAAVRASRTINGALIPTACGKGTLAQVHQPTLFALRYGIIGGLLRLRGEFEAKQAEAERYANRSGIIDWIDSRLSGTSTYYEMAQRSMIEANRLIDRYNELVEPANALAEHLEDLFEF